MRLEDEAFLRGINERAEGSFPGLPEHIEVLCREEYGRPISIWAEGQRKVIGIVLPVNEEQLRHLVLLRNGMAWVIEPSQKSNEANREAYKRVYVPGEEPIDSFADSVSGVVEAVRAGRLAITEPFSHQVVAQNTNPDQVSLIYEAMDQAIVCAGRLKEQREKAINETITKFMGQIDGLLNPLKP